MVSTRKKRQSNERLLSQLDDFDQDIIIGNAAGERQENTVVNKGTNDRDFTVGTSNDSSIGNGNAMSVKTLVMMMICKTWVKPFDVLIENRMTIMT